MSSDSDEKVNVESEKFDPSIALRSDHVTLPFPDVVPLDNIAKFESYSKRLTLQVDFNQVPQARKKPEPEDDEPEEKPSTSSYQEEPVTATGRPKKNFSNVLTRMQKTQGPLAFLRHCIEKKLRIKVQTRNAAGIRGHCLGYLHAFDKHWNLALVDVHEVWSRKVKRKSLLLGEPNDLPLGWKAMGPSLVPPKVVVMKTEKGFETCERHVEQMLMRGEHIVTVSALDDI